MAVMPNIKANLPQPGETKAQFFTRVIRILMKAGKSKDAAMGIAQRIWDNVTQHAQVTPGQVDANVSFSGQITPNSKSNQGGRVSYNPNVKQFAELSNKLDSIHQQRNQSNSSLPIGFADTLQRSIMNGLAPFAKMMAIGGPQNNNFQQVVQSIPNIQSETNQILGQLIQINGKIYEELTTIRSTGMQIKRINRGKRVPNQSDYWNQKNSLPGLHGIKIGGRNVGNFIEQFAQPFIGEFPALEQILNIARFVANPTASVKTFASNKIRGFSTKLREMFDPNYRYAQDLDQLKADAGIKTLKDDELLFKVQTDIIPQSLADLKDADNQKIELLTNIYTVARNQLSYLSQGQINHKYESAGLERTRFNRDKGIFQTQSEYSKYLTKTKNIQEGFLQHQRDLSNNNPLSGLINGALNVLDRAEKRLHGVSSSVSDQQLSDLIGESAKDRELAALRREELQERKAQHVANTSTARSGHYEDVEVEKRDDKGNVLKDKNGNVIYVSTGYKKWVTDENYATTIGNETGRSVMSDFVNEFSKLTNVLGTEVQQLHQTNQDNKIIAFLHGIIPESWKKPDGTLDPNAKLPDIDQTGKQTDQKTARSVYYGAQPSDNTQKEFEQKLPNILNDLKYQVYNKEPEPLFVKVVNFSDIEFPTEIDHDGGIIGSKYHSGGRIKIPRKKRGYIYGYPNNDEIRITAQKGEYILTKGETKGILYTLKDIKNLLKNFSPTSNLYSNNTSVKKELDREKLQRDQESRDNVQKNIAKYTKKIYEWLKKHENSFTGQLDQLLKHLSDIAKNIQTGQSDILDSMKTALAAAGGWFAKKYKDKFKDIKNIIKRRFSNIKSKFTNALKSAGRGIGNVARLVGPKIGRGLVTAGKSIGRNALKFGRSIMSPGTLAFAGATIYSERKLAELRAKENGTTVDEELDKINEIMEGNIDNINSETFNWMNDNIESDNMIDIRHSGGPVQSHLNSLKKRLPKHLTDFQTSSPGIISSNKDPNQSEVPILAQKDEYLLTKGETKLISKQLENLNQKFELGDDFYNLVDTISESLWYLKDREEYKVLNDYKFLQDFVFKPIKDFNGFYPFLVSAIREGIGSGGGSGGSDDSIFSKIKSGFQSFGNSLGNFFFGDDGENRPSGMHSGNGYSGKDTVASILGDKSTPAVGAGSLTSTSGFGSYELGDIMAKRESGKNGTAQISNNSQDKGGASYGKYQFALKPGSLRNFVNSLKDKNPEMYNQLNNAFSSAGRGKHGEFGQIWSGLATNKEFQQYEKEYAQKQYYHDPLNRLSKKNPELAKLIDENPGLKEAFYSTNIQHGEYNSIFKNTYKSGMGVNDLLDKVYDYRSAVMIKNYKGTNLENGLRNRYGPELQDMKNLQKQFESGQLGPKKAEQAYTPEMKKISDLKQQYEAGKLSGADKESFERFMQTPQYQAFNQAQQAAESGAGRDVTGGYMAIAEKYAKDATAAYGRNSYQLNSRRMSENMFDCSSHVGRSLKSAGLPIEPSEMTTRNMIQKLSPYFNVEKGKFTSGEGLNRGDILLTPGSHTEFYAGNGQTLGSRGGNYRGKDYHGSGFAPLRTPMRNGYTHRLSLKSDKELMEAGLTQEQINRLKGVQADQAKQVAEKSNIEQLQKEIKDSQVLANMRNAEELNKEMPGQQEKASIQDGTIATTGQPINQAQVEGALTPKNPDMNARPTPGLVNMPQEPINSKRTNLADNQRSNPRTPDYATQNIINQVFHNQFVSLQQMANFYALGNNPMSAMHV